MLSQFRKLEQDFRTNGDLKWKHVMHLIRLLISGITILRDSYVPVNVGEYKEKLLALRLGQSSWSDINDWRLALHGEFDRAYASTSLPDRPDYEWTNSFLVAARRRMVKD